MANILTRLLTAGERRIMAEYEAIAATVGELEPSVQPLSDEQLVAKTAEFRSRIEQGEPLDDLLPEAFAVVREASVRVPISSAVR